MKNYQKTAIRNVGQYALQQNQTERISQLLETSGVQLKELVRLLQNKPVTINFHPDRFSNNGRTILDNLIDSGEYRCQFQTGTSNGALTAFVGGSRYDWEQRIFFGAYPDDALDRPKYGALNLFDYIDGGCVRFGSCYFVLKPEINTRCTFAYGDSSSSPDTLCSFDTLSSIAAGLILDTVENGQVLDRSAASVSAAVRELFSHPTGLLGRNLDHSIEVHIHGDILLCRDVAEFWLDDSFRGTAFEERANALCTKYGITLHWIPPRRLRIDSIDDDFRGETMRPLAEHIHAVFGNNSGTIDAEQIGQASRDASLHPENWSTFGNAEEMFQYIKQLWHTIGYFGTEL